MRVAWSSYKQDVLSCVHGLEFGLGQALKLGDTTLKNATAATTPTPLPYQQLWAECFLALIPHDK